MLHEPYICTLKSPELASGFLQDVTVRGHALAARQDFGRLASFSAATVIINHQSSRQGRRGGFILVQRSSSLLLGRHAGTRFVVLVVQSLHVFNANQDLLKYYSSAFIKPQGDIQFDLIFFAGVAIFSSDNFGLPLFPLRRCA